MSKAQRARLLVLEAGLEGRELPKPAIVAIKAVTGTISASVPGQTEPEFFSDEAELEVRANELGMRYILALVVDGRRGATVQEKAPCAA